MEPTISVERVEPSLEDRGLCHVDQLSERERDCLVQLTSGARAGDVDWRTAASLSEYGVIKSTEYVRVTYNEPSGGGEGIGVNS